MNKNYINFNYVSSTLFNTRRNFLYQLFYYRIFQFREKRITLRIFVGKNTKLYNNGMKL